MADKPITAKEWAARNQAKVRYRRANLTIWRSRSIVNDPNLEAALLNHRSGSATDEDVAWVFVRSRVASHSPSFSWNTAELQGLLTAITAVSTSPAFKDVDPKSVVDALFTAREKEVESLGRLVASVGETIKRSMRGLEGPVASAFKQAAERSTAISKAFFEARAFAVNQAIGGMALQSQQTAWRAIADSVNLATSAMPDALDAGLSAGRPAQETLDAIRTAHSSLQRVDPRLTRLVRQLAPLTVSPSPARLEPALDTVLGAIKEAESRQIEREKAMEARQISRDRKNAEDARGRDAINLLIAIFLFLLGLLLAAQPPSPSGLPATPPPLGGQTPAKSTSDGT